MTQTMSHGALLELTDSNIGFGISHRTQPYKGAPHPADLFIQMSFFGRTFPYKGAPYRHISFWFHKFYFESMCRGPVPYLGRTMTLHRTQVLQLECRAEQKPLLRGRVRSFRAVLDVCALRGFTDLTDIFAVPAIFCPRSSA